MLDYESMQCDSTSTMSFEKGTRVSVNEDDVRPVNEALLRVFITDAIEKGLPSTLIIANPHTYKENNTDLGLSILHAEIGRGWVIQPMVLRTDKLSPGYVCSQEGDIYTFYPSSDNTSLVVGSNPLDLGEIPEDWIAAATDDVLDNFSSPENHEAYGQWSMQIPAVPIPLDSPTP